MLLDLMDRWMWWMMACMWTCTWYGMLVTFTITTLVVSLGDYLLTLALRLGAASIVGKSISIRWSFLQGSLVVENLCFSPSLLEPQITPYLPATVDKATLHRVSLSVPIFAILYQFFARKLDAIPTWGMEVDGLDVALVIDPAMKWRWKVQENKARFAAAVENAKSARLQLLEAHTALILQKLVALATPPPPSPSPTATVATSASSHEVLLDAIAQKVKVSFTNIAIKLFAPTTGSLTFQWSAFRLCPSTVLDPLLESRQIELLGVGMAINPLDAKTNLVTTATTSVLYPFDLRIVADHAPVLQGLLKTSKDVHVALEWPELHLSMEPTQMATLNAIVAPMADHATWLAQAAVTDQLTCVDIGDPTQYISDYKAHVAYTSQGIVPIWRDTCLRRFHSLLGSAVGSNPSEDEAHRVARLQAVEATSVVMDVLALRREALAWPIPSYGDALPHISDTTKAAADLDKFLVTPVEHYIAKPNAPPSPPFLNDLTVALALDRVSVQCWSSHTKPVLELYMDAISTTMTATPTATSVELIVRSIGLHDLRKTAANVFPHILGRNPDCSNMVQVACRVDSANDVTVNCVVANFSFLLVTSPLIEAMQALALDEDEDVLIWRDDVVVPPPPSSPPVVYMEQVDRIHNPTLLQSMGLDATVRLAGCELCLLADPSSLQSHILALTCDVEVRAQSNRRGFETVTIAMSDVALQPCKVQMTADGIDLEIPGLRTLLELEGDGVDVEVHYEMHLPMPPPTADPPAKTASSSVKSETKRAWGVLKKAIEEGAVPDASTSTSVVAVGGAPAQPRLSGSLAPVVDNVAQRKLRLKVSDFALNVSKEDIGLFGAIQSRLEVQLEVPAKVLEAAQGKADRVSEARKRRLQEELTSRLRHQFDALDTDGGGSLDYGELMKLVEVLVADMGLTAEETQKCHETLVRQVDRDESGDVSFDEFEAALNPVEPPYLLLHQGTVQLTAQEFANPRLRRNHVPRLHRVTGQPVHLNDAAALAVFWKKYELQTGASKTSLHQQSPRVVQEKMVRVFKSLEYAQEAWTTLVNPNLKPAEQCPWMLLPREVAGAGTAQFEQTLTKQGTLDKATSLRHVSGLDLNQFEQDPVIIRTEVHTEFGGFYFRMVDKMLPAHTPALEFALEDVQLHGSVTTKETSAKQALDAVVLTFHTALYCKYYNTSARQLEPFIEYYPLQMAVKKDPGQDLACYLVSDYHLQMNVTATFMKALTATQAAFYDAPTRPDAVERDNIKALKGLCWICNQVGVPFTYYVESRKADKHKGATEVQVSLASEKATVQSLQYAVCRLLNEEDDLKGAMAENLKEKEMRAAFRAADKDHSGELDSDEVHEVLRSVLKVYDDLSSAEIDKQVKDFMDLADSDKSQTVSWKEFQLALAKTRTVALRTLSIEIDGFEPIHGITLDGLGEDMVVELIPKISIPFDPTNIESMYNAGKAYLTQEDVSVDDLNRGVYLMHLVAEQDPRHSWTQSWLDIHEPKYCPRLLAVHVTVDNTHGMTVTIKTAEYIRNETAKLTQVLLLDAHDAPSELNPPQPDSNGLVERYVLIAPYSSFSIPLPLLEHGAFMIRQVGEVEWSHSLPLTVWPGRQTGHDVTPYLTIDDQPTTIERFKEGAWAIVLRPQLIVQNTLPCVVEYKIVQRFDVYPEAASSSSTGRRGSIDVMDKWFDKVDQVNCRHMSIASGATMQVSGLKLDEPAYMKVRLMVTEGHPVGGWSPPFQVAIHADSYEKFSGLATTTVRNGPTVQLKYTWTKHVPRTMDLLVPYWIQNRSGLDLRYKIAHGDFCTWEQHAEYFGDGFHTVPMLVTAPLTKATMAVLPYRPTPFEFDWQASLAPQVRKFLPAFESLKYSQPIDMTAVGTFSELSCGVSGCVLGYEIAAAPSQFQQSKVLVLLPRYVVVNQVQRPLQFTALTLAIKTASADNFNVLLKPHQALIIYRFRGKDKQVPALRCRDALVNDVWKGPGPWAPVVPLSVKQATCVWLRGPLGAAPYIEMDVQPSGGTTATTFVLVKDRTLSPAIRIENRSTQYALRYVQLGVKSAQELVVPPMRWHTFAWDSPFESDLKLKVYIGSTAAPTHVDLMQMKALEKLTTDEGRTTLYGEVYIDGNTRVLAVGDEAVFHEDRRLMGDDLVRDMVLDVGLHGVGITIVDDTEVMNVTLDGLHMTSPAHSNAVTYDLHHFQVDDMTYRPMFPVLICPADSGYNSNKKEGWLVEHGEHPWFHMVIDSVADGSMLVLNEFVVAMGSLDIKLNLDYILHVLDVFWSILYPPQTADEMELAGQVAVRQLLNQRLEVPDAASLGQLMYFKHCEIQAYRLNVVLHSAPEDSDSGLSKMLGSTAGNIIGGIAHITPEFYIRNVTRDDRFLYYDDFLWNTVIFDTIVGSCVSQWYKVVGSMEVLGDPVGLLHEFTDGLALAVRQTKREFTGKSRHKGQGAVTLMQTLIGAPSEAIGKASNGVGDILKKATQFESQENESEPRHLPEGMLQSGMVLGKSLAYGVSGLVTKPMDGMKESGFGGFAKGVGQGAVGLVASPFIGVIGVVEKLSQSMHNTTHLMDEKHYEGTRRIARKGALKSIEDSPLLAEIEVLLDKVSGVPLKSNVKVYVTLNELLQPADPSTPVWRRIGKEVDKFKSKTRRHAMGQADLNQSRIVDVTSIDMVLVFDVVHKRKPLPRKSLGKLYLTMEQVYEHFAAMPKRFKSNATIKEHLKSRKVHQGSIFAQSLEPPKVLKSKKESPPLPPLTGHAAGWEQAFQRAANILKEEHDTHSYTASGSVHQRTSQSNMSNGSASGPREDATLPPKKSIAFALVETDEGAPKLHLNIRYFNTMRS
ncbi:hypothetical protein H257_02903 [Aphanomyces astaci]|uniref:EF-hand domain-containing protein n=1 Tax=Aphanomyces astaci TaxID=112090 RepID=W4GZD0_APHAT|nr:hypothetical protein H257_02903 [Aphanomyces astaci]ETV85012.1 hypothetical protein H257_02903 [Aphanomyces astaci]|eukprot:XP_009825030.1 hypothetical protein H257_02903 [Aphanomyces astaci]